MASANPEFKFMAEWMVGVVGLVRISDSKSELATIPEVV